MYRGAQAQPGKCPINLPKTVRLIRILDAQIQTDQPTDIITVKSEKGFIGTRVSGCTQGVPWTVDLYGGCCYIVNVQGYQSEQKNTPLRVVTLLRSQLPS